MDNNQLTTVAPELGGLTFLETLVLRGNAIEELPTQLDGLKNLQILTLNSNKLHALPSFIGKLTALRVLTANGNNIKTVAAELSFLKGLERINLANNNIEELPPQLHALWIIPQCDSEMQDDSTTAVKTVALLEGNPIQNPTPPACEVGAGITEPSKKAKLS